MCCRQQKLQYKLCFNSRFTIVIHLLAFMHGLETRYRCAYGDDIMRCVNREATSVDEGILLEFKFVTKQPIKIVHYILIKFNYKKYETIY